MSVTRYDRIRDTEEYRKRVEYIKFLFSGKDDLIIASGICKAVLAHVTQRPERNFKLDWITSVSSMVEKCESYIARCSYCDLEYFDKNKHSKSNFSCGGSCSSLLTRRKKRQEKGNE